MEPGPARSFDLDLGRRTVPRQQDGATARPAPGDRRASRQRARRDRGRRRRSVVRRRGRRAARASAPATSRARPSLHCGLRRASGSARPAFPRDRGAARRPRARPRGRRSGGAGPALDSGTRTTPPPTPRRRTRTGSTRGSTSNSSRAVGDHGPRGRPERIADRPGAGPTVASAALEAELRIHRGGAQRGRPGAGGQHRIGSARPRDRQERPRVEPQPERIVLDDPRRPGARPDAAPASPPRPTRTRPARGGEREAGDYSDCAAEAAPAGSARRPSRRGGAPSISPRA